MIDLMCICVEGRIKLTKLILDIVVVVKLEYNKITNFQMQEPHYKETLDPMKYKTQAYRHIKQTRKGQTF